MNGKREQEKSSDRQCKHCGLWFDRRGHIPHQRNCDFQEYDRPIIPLEDDAGGGTEEASGEQAPAPTDGVGDGPTPEGSDPSDDPARTDGSGLGLEGPPETPTEEDIDEDVTGDDVQDETVDCPGCGADTGATEDELAAMDKPSCTECGTRVVVR